MSRTSLLAGALVLLLTGAASANPMAKALDQSPPDTCGSFGTSVRFVEAPAEAAKLAKKQEKLLFVLHLSGNFEDPRFT